MINKLRFLNALVIAVLVASALFAGLPVQPALAVSSGVVISQVYGGGGNTGALYKNDFIELFNRGTTSVDLSTMSVQYASSGGSSWQMTALSGTLAAGQYYLVQEAAGACTTGACATALPTPDATGTIAMSGTAGKVVLVSQTTLITAGTLCPTSNVVDILGFGAATLTCNETTPTANLSNSTAALRNLAGCTDTDSNSADFTITAPAPRNTATTKAVCSSSIPPSGIGSATPTAVLPGHSVLLAVVVTPGADPVSTGLSVSADLTAIGGGAAQAFYDDGTNGDVTASDNTFSFSATVGLTTTAGAKTLPFTVSDTNSTLNSPIFTLAGPGASPAPNAVDRSTTGNINLAIHNATVTPIHTIQGAGHLSPYLATWVTTSGVVTATRAGSNGFYIQDPNPDADIATSEGVFVYTSSVPTVEVGDVVTVSGTISEYRAAAVGLTLTEIASPNLYITIESNDADLPDPVVIGVGGRIPPAATIYAGSGSAEAGPFNPTTDGIAFYESMEGMYVQVNDAVATGPTASFSGNHEISVLSDNGANAGTRTARGGIIITSTDFNPERIILNDWISGGAPDLPIVKTGDTFPGVITGVMDYSFNNYKLQVITLPEVVSGGLTRELAPAATHNQLTIAAFNVENLAPSDPQSKFDELASLILNNLDAPDLLAIEEIQDNSGATNNGVVAANTTYFTLINAISTISGGDITYAYRQIDPVNNQDGGATGGNIRQGFLFRTDRGLAFVDRPGGDATTATTVLTVDGKPQLSYSPGRIDPTNVAFNSSRKPLAGEFTINGRTIFVVGNHFNSKGGDEPLYGWNQPPLLTSEVQRLQQAAVVKNFVQSILAVDPNANVVVLGDLNDFEFSNPLGVLKTTPLNVLIETLPANERYTYVFEGNSQAIDHTLVSDNLMTPAYDLSFDVVHVNSEFSPQASDHEPQITRLFIQDAPQVDQGIPAQEIYWGRTLDYAFPANAFVDPNASLGDTLSYTAALSDDSALPAWLSFDGDTRTFSGTPDVTDLGDYTLKVTATDLNDAKVSTTFVLSVLNHAPFMESGFAMLAMENERVSFQIPMNAFWDEDLPFGDALRIVSISGLPSWAFFNPSDYTISGTPVDPYLGLYLITLTVSDRADATTTDIFPLLAFYINQAPEVNYKIADRTTLAGKPFSMTFGSDVFTDRDVRFGDSLTFTATLADGSPLPAWLHFNPDSYSFYGVSGQGDIGPLQIKVTATDSGGLIFKKARNGGGEPLSASTTFKLTVLGQTFIPVVAGASPDR